MTNKDKPVKIWIGRLLSKREDRVQTQHVYKVLSLNLGCKGNTWSTNYFQLVKTFLALPSMVKCEPIRIRWHRMYRMLMTALDLPHLNNIFINNILFWNFLAGAGFDSRRGTSQRHHGRDARSVQLHRSLEPDEQTHYAIQVGFSRWSRSGLR